MCHTCHFQAIRAHDHYVFIRWNNCHYLRYRHATYNFVKGQRHREKNQEVPDKFWWFFKGQSRSYFPIAITSNINRSDVFFPEKFFVKFLFNSIELNLMEIEIFENWCLKKTMRCLIKFFSEDFLRANRVAIFL